MKIFDRYVLGQFLPALGFALLSFVTLFLALEFIDKLSRFLDHGASAWTLFRYFAYRAPYVLVMMLPIAVLLATFLTLGQMARFRELVAIATAGESLARVALPVLFVAALCSFGSFALGELVVPRANAERDRILEQEIDKVPPPPKDERTDVTVRGQNGYVYVVRLYFVPDRRMHDISIYRYESGRLTRRIDARLGEWDGGAWVLKQGFDRTFDADSLERARPFDRLRFASLEGPEDFGSPPDDPDELGYFDLRRYLVRAAARGMEVGPFKTKLHVKLAFPLVNLIVAVIGCALAMELRTPTPALSFGLSVSIAFAYFGVLRFFQILGEGAILPPWLAGWAPTLLFGSWAAYLFYRLQRR
ncbi:MAG TPA: LptF/LptG family permease [Candidatus Eisenbacteria bacterium]|nr:LptF/LptG family permease [Candidatus Eisenbacteria bacterium]